LAFWLFGVLAMGDKPAHNRETDQNFFGDIEDKFAVELI
jgi:hypothetical protein